MYNANSDVNIVVKTPVGKSSQESIYNVVLQGYVFSPVLCSKQIDTFGKECLTEKKYTYLYKGKVEIPPLSMVDDVVCVAECGFKSVLINSFLSCKSNTKKLQFGAGKCKKMHIGKQFEEYKCHPIYVDNWNEFEKKNEVGQEFIEDICVGQVQIEHSEEEKYLGDIIAKDGRNIKNIQARVNKGKGIIKRILEILEGIPFGKLYYQVAIILRNSLLVSSVLCNSEAWFNITQSEFELIESVDLIFLRNLLGAPKTVPKEILFLELGVVPLREIVKQKRLNFLHYILSQEKESIIYRVFESQRRHPNKKDWVKSVEKDLEELELNISFEEIRKMTKYRWKNIVKNTIHKNSFFKLEAKKQTHSKVKDLEHIRLEMQDYFMPNGIENMSKEEVQLIFKIRGKTTNVKMNRKNQFETYECSVCFAENETQEHIYQCEEIWKLKKQSKKEIPKFEEILYGNIQQKVKVPRIFQENMKIRGQNPS